MTPEGLNVFPDDVERVLDDQPGVRESAVVGATSGGQERVHAVLVLEPCVSADAVVSLMAAGGGLSGFRLTSGRVSRHHAQTGQ